MGRYTVFACICGVWYLTENQLNDHWLNEHVRKNKPSEYEDVEIAVKWQVRQVPLAVIAAGWTDSATTESIPEVTPDA